MLFDFPDYYFLAIDNAFDREAKYIAFLLNKFPTIAAFLSINIDNPRLGEDVSFSILKVIISQKLRVTRKKLYDQKMSTRSLVNYNLPSKFDHFYRELNFFGRPQRPFLAIKCDMKFHTHHFY